MQKLVDQFGSRNTLFSPACSPNREEVTSLKAADYLHLTNFGVKLLIFSPVV